MKTPKREYPIYYESGINPENGDLIMDALAPELYEARWKRKNRIAQLKRTIARLTDELQNEREKSSFFYVAYSRMAEQLTARKEQR